MRSNILNQEAHRRENTIRFFPNIDVANRLVGDVLINNDEYWTSSPHLVQDDLYLPFPKMCINHHSSLSNKPFPFLRQLP